MVVKLSLCVTKHYAVKMYGGVDVQIHVFLTSALLGDEQSASRSGRPVLGEKALGANYIGDCVGPKNQSGRYGAVTILDPTWTRTPISW
jgi:hypothetical protein